MDLEKKTKRIIVLSISFFLLGAFFFVLDATGNRNNKKQAPITEERVTVSDSVLKNYPDPAIFEHFTYGANQVQPENLLEFSGKCSAKYTTFIIFPTQFDYRNDPAKAVFNRAILCPPNGEFSYNIYFRELTTLPTGEYYAFVAEQAEGQMWYNPR